MSITAYDLQPAEPLGKSAVHRLTLALVWLAVALSAVVFSEPAPFDLLMMGLIVLLPMIGLCVLTPSLVVLVDRLAAGRRRRLSRQRRRPRHAGLGHPCLHHPLPVVRLGGDCRVRAAKSGRTRAADDERLSGRGGDRDGRRTDRLLRHRAAVAGALHRLWPRPRHLQGPQRLWRLPGPGDRLRDLPLVQRRRTSFTGTAGGVRRAGPRRAA